MKKIPIPSQRHRSPLLPLENQQNDLGWFLRRFQSLNFETKISPKNLVFIEFFDVFSLIFGLKKDTMRE